ncbi:serine hydrolase domain-containing protein [Neobacillus sp. WH10]|uniref:serine hydrolase domain-containing protein n=1 Tax=Neobacillus sp. WH10 TaxID=3047873 RepID=UPI0024C16150|nr:serine hydrolase domain-containing protein [Neobacillus sp. WH10]WHY76768.1 serine hydrolase domain-containing protein [Neobacillus sp. WH10]
MRRTIYKWLLLVSSIFFGTAGCQNSINILKSKYNVSAHYENNQTENSIQKGIRKYLISHHVNGSIAIVKKNEIIFQEGVGFANRKRQIANQPSTAHPIASITKLMVATSIMQLQDQGKLTIQDSVSTFIPDFPNGKNIKLIHLLNHTSGIQAPRWDLGKKKPAAIVKRLNTTSIRFPAGTQWDYNDINYLVLGFIVEKVSGEPLHKYIQKNIFNKASMGNSGFISDMPPVYSTGYLKLGNQLIPAKRLNTNLLFGCGDIYSTVLDLCLFDEALMSGKLISKQSLKEMLTPGPKSNYGLGLYVLDSMVYSRGAVGGWESLHVYFKNKTSIAILLNVRDKGIDIHQVAKDVYKMMNEKHL